MDGGGVHCKGEAEKLCPRPDPPVVVPNSSYCRARPDGGAAAYHEAAVSRARDHVRLYRGTSDIAPIATTLVIPQFSAQGEGGSEGGRYLDIASFTISRARRIGSGFVLERARDASTECSDLAVLHYHIHFRDLSYAQITK